MESLHPSCNGVLVLRMPTLIRGWPVKSTVRVCLNATAMKQRTPIELRTFALHFPRSPHGRGSPIRRGVLPGMFLFDSGAWLSRQGTRRLSPSLNSKRTQTTQRELERVDGSPCSLPELPPNVVNQSSTVPQLTVLAPLGGALGSLLHSCWPPAFACFLPQARSTSACAYRTSANVGGWDD